MHLENVFSVLIVVSDTHIIIVQFTGFASLVHFVFFIFLFFKPQSPLAVPRPRGSCLGLALPYSQLSLPRLGSSA